MTPAESDGLLAGLLGFGCLAAVAVLALLVVLVLLGRRRNGQRRDTLRRWAGRNGWVYVPLPTVDWGTRLPGGNRAGVAVVVSGVVAGQRVSVAEYNHTETYTGTGSDGMGGTTSTTSSHSHPYVVVVVHLGHAYPSVEVSPRGPAAQVGRALAGGGGAVTGDRDFDRAFRVEGDPVAVRWVLSPALVAAHVAGSVPPWILHQGELMTYLPGRLDQVDRIPALAEPLTRVAAMLPRLN
ncbi:hypothetical protein [Micromonospora sp. NBC_01796]|uniref:hypothetical protein n=1 Tax=Micromonospora sp. NBC_01796 TaxID=2975987 RepID=UPI002DD90EE4|nr:hypothetical protein [Micromonospora sp. NBC_01796]WSA84939.1 hypothetical protein OIE47_32015 [Micromonospora sp. NBC_01796]